MEIWIGWLILAGVMFVIEIFTAGFLVFWFGIAALVAMAISFFIDNILIQLAIFVILSFILVLSTKPLINKYVLKDEMVKTNVYTIIGKKATVSIDINSSKGTGQIKIGSDVWSAKTEDGKDLKEGTLVEILRVEGVKVIVKEVKESKEE